MCRKEIIMNTTEVTIKGEKFTIDLDRAQELGLCKKVAPLITELKAGDVFIDPKVKASEKVIAVQQAVRGTWLLVGNCGGLSAWSVPNTNWSTQYEVLDWLNSRGWKLIGNVNEQFKQLVKELTK